MIERPDPTPTLGERLDAEARALLARARHSFGWSGAYQALTAHLAGLTAPPAWTVRPDRSGARRARHPVGGPGRLVGAEAWPACRS